MFGFFFFLLFFWILKTDLLYLYQGDVRVRPTGPGQQVRVAHSGQRRFESLLVTAGDSSTTLAVVRVQHGNSHDESDDPTTLEKITISPASRKPNMASIHSCGSNKPATVVPSSLLGWARQT